MAEKYVAWCHRCANAGVGSDEMPCAGCGFHSFWPFNHPNHYVAVPEPVDEAVVDAPVPVVVIEEDEYYHCRECGKRHKYASKVGASHLEYRS